MQANVTLHTAGPGEELRRARETRGLSIGEAAEVTCIVARYLRALEEDAPVEAFPAPVYARFFLREYARFLGLDEGPLLSAFDQRNADEMEPEPIALPVEQPERRGRSPFLVALSTLALVALAVVSVTSRESRRPEITPSPSPAAVVAPEAPAPPSPAPAEVRAIKVVISAHAPCWVQATSDGEVVFSQTVPAGEKIRLRARRTLDLRLGNAGGVTLTVNGEPVRTSGTVVDYSFVLRGGEVRQR